MEISVTIPWYWAPYIVALGALDWWEEASEVTHVQAISEGIAHIAREKHGILRSIAALALMLALLVLFVRVIAGPLLKSGVFQPSPDELRWGSFLIAAGGILFALSLLALAVYRHLCSLYRRGYRRYVRVEMTRS